MNSRTIDVVTGWETVAIPAGYEGLRQLANREFSGGVSAGPAWAFFLNGRIVGLLEGSLEDFEDVDVTAYRAADPSLPLLFSMQERDGETRASYYTKETPLRDVDATLSGGGFTGYVELSENVLSGDYYVVYHGGKSMSAAFVGSSERLVTGEEAFETAADEVGIYEVVDVDVDLVDIPEPDVDDGDDAGAAAADPEPSGAVKSEPADDDNTGASDPAPDADPSPEAGAAPVEPGAATPPDGVAADPASDDESTETGSESAPDPEVEPEADTGPEADTAPEVDATAEADPDDVTGVAGEQEAPTDASVDSGDGGDAVPGSPTGSDHDGQSPERTGGGDAGATSGDRPVGSQPGGPGGPDGSLTDEQRWQQARTIPSLDPDESTGRGQAADDDVDDRDAARERTAQMQRQRRRNRAARDRAGTDGADRSAASGSEPESRTDSGAAETLRKQLSSAKDRIDSLEAEREDLLAARETLAEERDSLRSELAERTERIEELEAECERLRAEVDRLESRLDAGNGGGAPSESMSPDRALSGTNLFVRYDTKGQATLKHAHAGEASRSDVRENLRLEHHTTFETEGVAVDGSPYEEFLRDSTEYTFARWVVSDLLYGIGETGNRSELAGVFDAIPDIDRVEVRGEVGVETDDGVEQRSFDVVFRDRMGDPLFVADINPSRDATTEAMVGSLVENTHTVAAEAETVAAGFYVTESFYEPGALETVADRTGGGILSRSKKRSFVKLSRKRGYHLCLVEARDGEFHLNVPEL